MFACLTTQRTFAHPRSQQSATRRRRRDGSLLLCRCPGVCGSCFAEQDEATPECEVGSADVGRPQQCKHGISIGAANTLFCLFDDVCYDLHEHKQ